MAVFVLSGPRYRGKSTETAIFVLSGKPGLFHKAKLFHKSLWLRVMSTEVTIKN
jgi:hypothetical protein